jgi:hypothetical protein
MQTNSLKERRHNGKRRVNGKKRLIIMLAGQKQRRESLSIGVTFAQRTT